MKIPITRSITTIETEVGEPIPLITEFQYFSEDFENILSLDTLKKDFDEAFKLMREKYPNGKIYKN